MIYHPDPTRQATRAILTDLFGPPETWGFAVRLWDGTIVGPPPDRPLRFTLVLCHPGALRRLLLPPTEVVIGEAYLRGDFEIEGDVEAAVGLIDTIAGRFRSPLTTARLAARLLALPAGGQPARRSTRDDPDGRRASEPAPRLHGSRHSRPRDAAAVRFHYNVGNEFYALWLDRRMQYSCAYFPTGREDLDTAQAAKLEYICRKLRLRTGDRLLDIGCGWGGLVQYAAERYGVRATGITLSEPQAALAQERIAAAGLRDRCRIEVCDYRDLPRRATFDTIVSVGMIEHVGRRNLPVYFAQAFRHLEPGGLFLNHGIVRLRRRPSGLASAVARHLWREGAFIQRYVFPDGELVTPGETITVAERAGFETRDVESLREHYARTLRLWVGRLERQREAAVALTGERTYRIWRLYMAASAHAFASGSIGVVQALFSRSRPDGTTTFPLSRAHLYAPRSAGAAADAGSSACPQHILSQPSPTP